MKPIKPSCILLAVLLAWAQPAFSQKEEESKLLQRRAELRQALDEVERALQRLQGAKPQAPTPQQAAELADKLLKKVPRPDAYGTDTAAQTAYGVNSRLYGLFYSGSFRDQKNWSEADLHPAMLRPILERFGYHPAGAQERDLQTFPYHAVPVLACMRKNGDAPDLDRIAKDGKQNATVRLLCLVALHGAGEAVDVPTLLEILAAEKRLDRRMIATQFLHHADDLKLAQPFLLEGLDDANAEMRQSVLYAIDRKTPASFLPRLKRSVEEKHDAEVLKVIANMESNEAQQFLADNLDRALKADSRDVLSDSLWAFQSRFWPQTWISAGQYDHEYIRKQARAALAHWEEHKKKKRD